MLVFQVIRWLVMKANQGLRPFDKRINQKKWRWVMKVPNWLKEIMKEMISDLFVEFLGVRSIKKFLTKGKEKADETVGTSTETERKGPEIKYGGLFNLDDEKNYLALIGKVEAHPDGKGKQYALKISTLLNSFPEEWQRRRFRVAVGMLNVDYDKTEVMKESSEERFPNGKLKGKKEKTTEKPVTRNLGVQVLVSLAQYNENQMMEICKASGILHSDLEAIKKAWERVVSWAEKQGPSFVDSINELTERIKPSPNYKEPEPKKPYSGFFNAFFGLK